MAIKIATWIIKKDIRNDILNNIINLTNFKEICKKIHISCIQISQSIVYNNVYT